MVIELSPRSFINLNDKTIDILYPGRGTIAVAKGKIINKISIEYEHIRYALMRSGDLCLVMKITLLCLALNQQRHLQFKEIEKCSKNCYRN